MARLDGRTDEQLAEAANRGDPVAFDTLYQRHKTWAARLAYRFTGNDDDAMDVVQEAFIYLLGRFPRFRLSSALTTFLYPVIKNIALSKLRKSRRIVLDEQLVLHAAEAAGQSTPERALADIVASLPAIHREVLLMRFVDDMKLEDIAQTLKAPLGTVKSRLHNALKTLREDQRIRGYFEETR